GRARSRKRSREAVEAFHERFVEGALARGVDRETAEHVFVKLNGFAAFGFPKSHAAAFGLLAYQSAWLRHHYPREFLCALLNAQPMGFYPPASLLRGGPRVLLWELGLAPRSQSVPGSAGKERQLALPLDPTAATPALREQSEWERMLADYRTTTLSVDVHPLALLRPHLPGGTQSSRE